MKHRATKDRRKEREEFVYMFRDEISSLLYLRFSDEKIKLFADQIARNWLEYHNTNYIDIWFVIKRDYIRLFNIK